MRIAQVSPLIEPVPPPAYGGTERIVSILTEGLVERRQEVTLFASADSVTDARLISTSRTSLRTMKSDVDEFAFNILQLQDVLDYADEFDIIHFHNDYIHFPISRLCGLKQLTTLHGRLDRPGLDRLYMRFRDMPLVSISNHQRLAIPLANWVATVHHGLPVDKYKLNEQPDSYLAFLGRISPEKGVEDAVKIAAQSGFKIKIAAKIDNRDREYYEKVKDLFKQSNVEFIGEIGDSEKQELLGKATALLFPIVWPEPFGLVMIEAMACGTPVIAYANGSVSEIIVNGVNGFMVNNTDEAIHAVSILPQISRLACRQEFEQRFTSARMIDDYINIYREIVNSDAGMNLKKTATLI